MVTYNILPQKHSTVFILLFFLFSSASIAQSDWTRLDTPGGGVINNLFKVNDSIFIASLKNNSIYTSEDRGKNWTRSFMGVQSQYGSGMRDIIWNSAKQILASTYNDGVIISSDSGRTWTKTNHGGGERMVNTDAGILFANDNGHSNYAYTRSLDSGKTWRYVPVPWVTGWYKPFSMASKGNNIYLGFGDSIIYSTNFGSSWRKFGHSFPAAGIYSITLLTDSLVLTGTGNGFFYSSDAGYSWIKKSNGIPEGTRIKVIPLNDTLYAIGKFGLFYSTNFGDDWIHYNNNQYKITINSLIKSNDLILAATGSGIFSIEENVWKNYSAGIYAYSPREFTIGNEIIYYNSTAGLFRSSDGGKSWENNNLEVFFTGVYDLIMRGNLFLTHAASRHFYISTNQGLSWDQTGYMDASSFLEFSKMNNKIYASFYKSNFPAGPTYGFYMSPDSGATWVMLPGAFRWSDFGLFTITQGDTIYANTSHLLNFTRTGIFKSTNQGYQWIETNNGLTDKNIQAISADKYSNVYCSNPEGIWKLNSETSSWNLLSSTGMSNVKVINFTSQNNLVILKNTSLYASADGINWHNISQGISNPIIKFQLDSLDYCYAAVPTGEVFKSTYPIFVPAGSEEALSEMSFSLHQNYPNPFNPKTTIQYSVGSTQYVQLKIYDILGNEAAVIVNEERTPGSYSVEFDASRFASGVYIYRLIAGENVLSRKMIVLK